MKKETTGNRRADKLREIVGKQGEASGYYLNPDHYFTGELFTGLAANEERYGYRSCPCRLATGSLMEDQDILCPCDYRDADLSQYGACYCGLYVSRAVSEGAEPLTPVPDSRPAPEERGKARKGSSGEAFHALSYPVFRCKVCGYLCARDEAPDTCPICKAPRERFERFL